MNVPESAAKGHLPTLIASFLHFDLSFMLWVLLGSLGIYIADSAGLTPGETGSLVAVPILSGSLLRIPLGLLSDHIGGKWTGVALLAFLFSPLFLGWQSGNNLPTLLGIGLLLGTAGASPSRLLCLWPAIGTRQIARGFVLPIVVVNAKEISGSFATGLLTLAALVFGAFFLLRVLSSTREGWRVSLRDTRGPDELIPARVVVDRVLMAPYLLP